ncbi:MAG: hypothetical protein R2772_09315 [Chitinophagales bacterium]
MPRSSQYMQGEKLYKIISVLDKKTTKKLIQFASCSIKNSRPEVVACLSLIVKHYQSLLAESLTEKELYALVYSEAEEFNKAKCRDLLHFCQLVLNDFLVEERLQANESLKQELLTEFYFQNGLYKEYAQELNRSLKQVEKSLTIDRKTELEKFELKIKQYLVDDEDYLKNKKSLVEEALVHLDSYYFTEKLKWSHELMVSNLYSSQAYSTPFLNKVLSEINQEPYSKNVFASIYYLITLFYKGNYSLEKYYKLKHSVIEIISSVNAQEKRSLVIDLANYARKLYMESNNDALIEEMHAINLLGIEYRVFIKKQKFNSHNAMNIVNIALRLELKAWAKEFCNSISTIIDNENTLLIMNSMVEFNLGNYEEVRKILVNVEFVDIYFAIHAKSFLAKAYFMLGEYELLNNHLSAMDLFYRRNKLLSEELIESNLNFVLTLKKIVKHVTTPSKLTNIKNKVEGVSNMAYKAWVQKILRERVA